MNAIIYNTIEVPVVVVFVLLVFMLTVGAMPVFALPGDGSDSLKMERRSLLHGGIERTYTLYLPPSYDGKKPFPLLFLLHGGGGVGKKMINFTGFDRVARDKGLIVVSPDGYERHWNDGRLDSGHSAQKEQIDDVGYIKQLLDQLSKELAIDSQRVYVAGISNGAMMSYRLALEMSDRIAAMAAVAGALPESLGKMAWNSRPVPAVIISGSADPLVPFGGGEVRFFRKKLGRVISVPDTVSFWVKHNQCNAPPVSSDLALKTNKSGLKVKKTSYNGCCNDAGIDFYVVEGGGHTWPRDSLFCQYLPAAVIGKACRDLDSTEIIWEFFTRHPLSSQAQSR